MERPALCGLVVMKMEGWTLLVLPRADSCRPPRVEEEGEAEGGFEMDSDGMVNEGARDEAR